jgi:hypothetical protein
MIAALYVEKDGVYSIPGIDLWDKDRDARRYPGPYRVIAHPPCERWGRFWGGSPGQKTRLVKGDDGGCFAAALGSVRRWGGVLEHPQDSAAWQAYGLMAPPRSGGWVAADNLGGWTCRVEQGHYGHRARKATWLYAFGIPLPSLRWGSSLTGKPIAISSFKGMTLQQRADRRAAMARNELVTGKAYCAAEMMSKKERLSTPIGFRDLLLTMVGYGS